MAAAAAKAGESAAFTAILELRLLENLLTAILREGQNALLLIGLQLMDHIGEFLPMNSLMGGVAHDPTHAMAGRRAA